MASPSRFQKSGAKKQYDASNEAVFEDEKSRKQKLLDEILDRSKNILTKQEVIKMKSILKKLNGKLLDELQSSLISEQLRKFSATEILHENDDIK